MYYDLDTVQELCGEVGFSCSRLQPDELEVTIELGVSLVFQNFRDEEDTLIGFRGTPWHAHGTLTLMRRDGSYAAFDELDIIQGLRDGNLVLLEMYLNGELRDRWIIHKEERVDVQDITPSEEIRVRRLQQ